ncbi:EAL domain-containing protein [Actinoplanes sp. N902-109]|uniref:EAL domain-containing protein n=1 Tax=Actinoplanes sp. (strain N902-109) TaxID=649831 RepID=UPI0003294E50|nr:EAL domain-containing protein [Actinoplanes sp. N902-109]AGL20808.1 PAS/PAC and GAF sensor-containing diguanylate cyclase/phosphodiesterase [Actinoplanes sp. N902-109]
MDGVMVGRLLGLARAHLGAELAVLSDISDGRQIVRAIDGAAPPSWTVGAELTDSYCMRVFDGSLQPVITDARRGIATRDLPFTARSGTGSYVGVPWRTADGSRAGILCCLSRTPDPRLGQDSARFLGMLAELIGDQVTSPVLRADSEDVQLLRDVLRHRTLRMVFQPVVRLADARVVGYESLARFDLTPFPTPAHAFATADRSGLGTALELLAVERAFEALPDMPYDTTLGVNLSAQALMAPAVQELLLAHAEGDICVELTEHTQVTDYAALNRVTDRLRANGVLLVVDDAGAGYASLRHILQLRPDIIKLDISLVRDIDADPVRIALTRSLVSFAGEVGARLVAEGIETRAEHDRLRDIGVHFGQGYYLAKPGPLPLSSAQQ